LRRWFNLAACALAAYRGGVTIAELQTNPTLRQHEFPVVQDQVFLSHAAVSPLPRRVAEAVQAYLTRAARGDQEQVSIGELEAQTRTLYARLLGADPDEIALVGPTSLGLSLVASGFPFKPGDQVLVYTDDYPSNVYPWLALVKQGVQIQPLHVKELGRIELADIQAQVTNHTRLVALASCHFISGWRIDIQGIGQFLRQRGIAFCVDGIQTLGAFPTPVQYVDFLAADAHKWLLGPCGAGVLYVRKAWQAQLQPPIYGWHNVECPGFVAQDQLRFKPDARRYEPGTANWLGVVGLKAAAELLLEVGIEAIATELLHKRQRFVAALQAKGWSVLQADAPAQHASAIISLYRADVDMPALHRKLAQARIITSLRIDRAGRHYVRVAPHFYNTDAELERLLEWL
jgi:selenocysteine lyase/cysteine desulfurase